MTPSRHPIGLKNRVLTTGSCFADAIGSRLARYKFQTLINPFGTVYNPVSIHKVLMYAIHNEPPAGHTYLQQNDVVYNYDFHSGLSALSKSELVTMLTNQIGATHYFLKGADVILLTYGTAWVYTRMDTGELVANCHKVPGSAFKKTLLTEGDILDSFREFHKALKTFNPGVQIILTVSPVRHLKDTLELNSVSKSIVRTACHRIGSEFESVEYFPAYELMLDDLRDYRFYKSDLIHPTEEAEEYIWEKFGERYFESGTQNLIAQWKNILSAINHRAFHPTASAHQQFLKDTLRKLEELKNKIDVTQEMAFIRSQLTP